jgi:hypothetical protein
MASLLRSQAPQSIETDPATSHRIANPLGLRCCDRLREREQRDRPARRSSTSRTQPDRDRVIDRFRGELTLLDSGRADGGGDTIEDVGRRAPAAARPATRAPASAGASWDAPKDDLDDEIPL